MYYVNSYVALPSCMYILVFIVPNEIFMKYMMHLQTLSIFSHTHSCLFVPISFCCHGCENQVEMAPMKELLLNNVEFWPKNCQFVNPETFIQILINVHCHCKLINEVMSHRKTVIMRNKVQFFIISCKPKTLGGVNSPNP